MKVLVTGATGYLGRNLIKKLTIENFEVYILIRDMSKSGYFNSYHNITLIELKTYEQLEEVIIAVDFDIVIHLAAYQHSGDGVSEISELIESNILLGTQILNAISKSDCKSFINIGTSWQHYNSRVYNPVNLYAATKQAFQDILRYFSEEKKIRVITLKLFDTYGTGDNRNKLVSYVIKSIKNNETLLLTKGEQKINLVHIDDVIAAIHISINRLMFGENRKYEEFALAPEEPIKVADLVKLILVLTNSNIKVNYGYRKYRSREVFEPWIDYKLLPGWKPQISLVDGLNELIDYTD